MQIDGMDLRLARPGSCGCIHACIQPPIPAGSGLGGIPVLGLLCKGGCLPVTGGSSLTGAPRNAGTACNGGSP